MSTDSTGLDLRRLEDDLAGDVILPGDDSWDTARQAWNLAVEQNPVAIVLPNSADDVAAAVRFAAENDLRIAFNGGGHNAGPIDWSNDTLLLKTERLQGIEIDAGSRRARLEAGVLGKPLAQALGEHGLCYLSGTSPDAGVVGYALGGGYSWMIRKFGLAANSVLAVELVTADGELVRADKDNEPDLFWALRGGVGANFGAVTAVELAVYPVAEIYAGCFLWPIERGTEILKVWREWVDTVPDECESIGRMLQLPDVPFLPEHLRGRSFVLVEPAFIGTESDGAALVQVFRDLEPEFDTVALMPTSDLSLVNMDPDFPLPYSGEGLLLDDLPPDAIETMVETFVGTPLLHVEVRHLGGALRSAPPDHGCVPTVDQPFLLFTFGLAVDAEMKTAVEHHVERLIGRFAPWDSGRKYLNFVESSVDPRSLFPEESYDRLQSVRARYDPRGMFVANHPIPPADWAAEAGTMTSARWSSPTSGQLQRKRRIR
jgi:FAD/FMN-containing dehydrogenase